MVVEGLKFIYSFFLLNSCGKVYNVCDDEKEDFLECTLMSVWGAGIFENDDALDWIYDLADSGTLSRVVSALDVILKNKEDDLEVIDCRIGLAAAEIIAAMTGDPSAELPEEAEEWIGEKILENEKLREKAQQVAWVILNRSELKNKWEKSSNYSQWQTTLVDLQKRLEN